MQGPNWPARAVDDLFWGGIHQVLISGGNGHALHVRALEPALLILGGAQNSFVGDALP